MMLFFICLVSEHAHWQLELKFFSQFTCLSLQNINNPFLQDKLATEISIAKLTTNSSPKICNNVFPFFPYRYLNEVKYLQFICKTSVATILVTFFNNLST